VEKWTTPSFWTAPIARLSFPFFFVSSSSHLTDDDADPHHRSVLFLLDTDEYHADPYDADQYHDRGPAERQPWEERTCRRAAKSSPSPPARDDHANGGE